MFAKRPKNVRIVRGNGEIVHCELTYIGRDEEGEHVWEVITPLQRGDSIMMSALPAKTAIKFPMSRQE